MGSTPPEKCSTSTSTSASAEDCISSSSSSFRWSSGNVSSTSSDAGNTSTSSSTGNASCSSSRRTSTRPTGRGRSSAFEGRNGTAYSRGGSTHSRRNYRCRSSTDIRNSGKNVNGWKASSRRCSSSALGSHIPNPRTAATGPGELGEAARGVWAQPATPTPASAPTEGHISSFGDCREETTAGLWNAFFAEESGMGLLLLQEMQRQMRAQHLQEENLLTLAHATTSSLPIWLNLRRILQTASAGAAAAAAAIPQEYAADAPILPTSLPEARASTGAAPLRANALVQLVGVSNTGGDSVRAGAVARCSASLPGCALSLGAAAPPAAGDVLCVDKLTLRTMLQLLPLLAFKESEQLLRCCGTAAKRTATVRAEAGCYTQPTHFLEAETCDVMVRRLSRMLHDWKMFVASSICSNNLCNRNTCSSNNCSYRSINACTSALWGSTLSNGGTAGRRSCNGSCASNTRHSPRSCEGTNLGSKVSTCGGECCTDYRGGGECTCNNVAVLVFAGEYLQQLLRQLLYPQALITAAVWGRQLYLHEQRRCPGESHGHTQTRLSSTHKPRQLRPFQGQKQEVAKTLKQLNEFQRAPQDKPRVSRSESSVSKVRSSQPELQGQQQGEQRLKRETQRRQQRQQVRQQPQPEYLDEYTLQSCLQRLLLLLRRPKFDTKSSEDIYSVKDTLRESQRQQMLVRYMLQILSVCGVSGEVRQDTYGDNQSTTGGSAVGGGFLDEPEGDDEIRQQQQAQRCRQPLEEDVDKHMPFCFRDVSPNTMACPRTIDGTGSKFGLLEHFPFATSVPDREGCDTNSTGVDEVAMRLCMQLLLCDSQLYIHLATPLVLVEAEEEQQSGHHSCSGIPLQGAATQQISHYTEQCESLAAAPACEFGCSLAGTAASVDGAHSGGLTSPGTAPAATFRIVAACTPAERAGIHALSAEAPHVAGALPAEETTSHQLLIETKLVANAARRPESIAADFAGHCPSRCTWEFSAAAPSSDSFSIHGAVAHSDTVLWSSLQKPSSFRHSQELPAFTILSEDAEVVDPSGEQPTSARGGGATYAAREQAEDTGTHHKIEIREEQRVPVEARELRRIASLGRAGAATHSVAGDQIVDAGVRCSSAPTVAFPPAVPHVTAAKGSTTGGLLLDRHNCCIHRSSRRIAATPRTVSRLCICPCVACSFRCDLAAAVAGENVCLPESGREARLAAAEAPGPLAPRRAGKPCTSGFSKEVDRVPKGQAAVASALLPPHRYNSPGGLSGKVRSTVPSCGLCTTGCSAQLNSTCSACMEGRDSYHTAHGSNRTVAVSWNNSNARSTTTTVFETNSVGPSHHTLPTVATDLQQRQDTRSVYSPFSEDLIGHPHELELCFRPSVLRVSLLRIHGSFRSFFRTSSHTSPHPATTALRGQELQRPLASEPQEHQQRHHSTSVDLSFRLPDLQQHHTDEAHNVFTPGESQPPVGSRASEAGCSDMVTHIQTAGRAGAAAELTTTVNSPSPHSAMEAQQGILSSRGVHVREGAFLPDPLNLRTSCGPCSCCVSREDCETHENRPVLAGDTTQRPQPATHAAEACCPSERCNAWFTQGAGIPDAGEPEDLLVCCFFESGAVTLNGRVVHFFDNGRNGGCSPYIVDVLLLSWYGADPLLSEPSSPALLPAAQLYVGLGERTSVTTGQHTASTVSTCSSSSSGATSGIGAPFSLYADDSCTSSGSGNNSRSWRVSVGTCNTRQDSNCARPRSRTSSGPPVLARGGRGQMIEETPVSTTRGGVDATLHSSDPYKSLASHLHQPHVCLLFLAANGTLFCSGHVPSVYLPQCISCGDASSSKGTSRRRRRLRCNSKTSVATFDSETNDSRVSGAGGNQCEGASPLTTARYGTLYNAVWLPAVCAATRRPLLFGSMLASNTAAVALTSNLLLPRYKRRLPLNQRQLSFSLLKYDPSTCRGSFIKQPDEAEPSFPGASLLPNSSRTAVHNSAGATTHGFHTHVEGFVQPEATRLQWRKAAAAAGSGAAVAVLQTHTGEPVLLQQHHEEAQTASALAVWRGDVGVLRDAFRSSDIPLSNNETFQRRHAQAVKGISAVERPESAGFILRFVTVPDVRRCSPLHPSNSSNMTENVGSTCCLEKTHVQNSRSVDGSSGTFKTAAAKEAECTAKAPGFAVVADGGLEGIAGGSIVRVGPEVDHTRVKTCEKGRVTQMDTFCDKTELQDHLHYNTANSEETESIPLTLSFLLDERWVACCLYKDLVLLKTAGHSHQKPGLPAVGMLVSNLEKEVHEWLATFFGSHPHVLRGAKYMRLGFERVSKRVRKRCPGPPLRWSATPEEKKQQMQQDQQPVHRQHIQAKHEQELQQQRHRRRNLGPHGDCHRRSQEQHEENSHHQHDRQSNRLRTQQQLRRYNQNCECTSATQVRQGEHTALSRKGEERVKCDSLSSMKADLSSSRNKSISHVVSVVAPESALEYRNTKMEIQIRALPLHASDSTDSSSSSKEEVTVEHEFRQGRLQQEVATAEAGKGRSGAKEEMFNLEEGDGELRLFVNTAEGNFYCLNLQRRRLETAWPEEFSGV